MSDSEYRYGNEESVKGPYIDPVEDLKTRKETIGEELEKTRKYLREIPENIRSLERLKSYCEDRLPVIRNSVLWWREKFSVRLLTMFPNAKTLFPKLFEVEEKILKAENQYSQETKDVIPRLERLYLKYKEELPEKVRDDNILDLIKMQEANKKLDEDLEPFRKEYEVCVTKVIQYLQTEIIRLKAPEPYTKQEKDLQAELKFREELVQKLARLRNH